MSKKPNVLQLNNQFIQDENQKRRFEDEELRRRHRFLGYILVIIMLLFTLPTYNLISSYVDLQKKEAEIESLKKDYKELSKATEAKKAFAKQLKNEDYILKYARSKFYYARDGEVIYATPDLLPK